MRRGYSDDCECLHCKGVRREIEQDKKEDREEEQGME